MSPFFNAQHERFAYLRLLLSLALGRCVAAILMLLAPLARKRKPSKDFLFFPYTHKDNSGTMTRFQDYFPFLDRDGFTYDIRYPSTAEEYDAVFHVPKASRAREYNHMRRLFWKRLRAVTKAPRYKAVFFQRQMYPEYYNQRRAVLEKLLGAYHNNVTVDFFDADYARNEPFFLDVIRPCDKVSVVNGFLYDYFSRHHPRVLMNDLGIDTSRYRVKTDYAVHRPVRIFWTGGVVNAANLRLVMPVLEDINASVPLTLVMVCRTTAGYTQPFIEHHRWDPETFNGLLAGSDIALYPSLEDNAISRGKVAYKALEYAAVKVPMVASPQGLSSRFAHGRDVLVANKPSEWKEHVLALVNDESLRKRLADSAYETLKQHHDVRVTYKNFLELLNA